MRRGATHRRVERRRADRNGERQTPSADAVRARAAANLRTAFGRQRCNACRTGVHRIRGRRRSSASRCELANGIRPPALQRLSRRRSPHTRQTPFLREPLRTCERHFVRHRFNAWHAGVRRIRGRRRSCANRCELANGIRPPRCNACRAGVRRIRAPSRSRPRNRTRDRPRPAPSPASSSRTVTFLLPPALGSRHITTRATFDAHDDEVRCKRAAPLHTI
nr:hypothetical protein DO63_2349 [Burkholderia pseudomallei]